MNTDTLQNYLETLSIAHYAAIGLLLFTLILWLAGSNRRRMDRKLLAQAPKLLLEDFQIAPLGKDAVFKLKNRGELATISQLDIVGRGDLMIKNEFSGHQIAKDKEYRIFLESAGHQKIDKGFSIEITFHDQKGTVFKQTVPLRDGQAQQLVILKRP